LEKLTVIGRIASGGVIGIILFYLFPVFLTQQGGFFLLNPFNVVMILPLIPSFITLNKRYPKKVLLIIDLIAFVLTVVFSIMTYYYTNSDSVV